MEISSKEVNKTVTLLPKFQRIIKTAALLPIYKWFVEIYDLTLNNSFHRKVEFLQYNAALAITGAIRGMSRDKIYP